MKIDNLFKSEIMECATSYQLKNFEKIEKELNFEDGMKGEVVEYDDRYIEVKFDNSWVLKIWHKNEYSMHLPAVTGIHACKYESLLDFMKRKGIKQAKQSNYKDSELYIIEFGK